MRFKQILNRIGFSGKAKEDFPASECENQTLVSDGSESSKGFFGSGFGRFVFSCLSVTKKQTEDVMTRVLQNTRYKVAAGVVVLAMLAVIGGFSLNSVYAQGVSDTEIDPSDSQIPAAPTVTAESCGNGCISVGVSGFRFTDGTTTAYTKRNWHYVEGANPPLRRVNEIVTLEKHLQFVQMYGPANDRKMIMETQYKKVGEDDWTTARRQGSPGDTGVRFQDLTGQGSYEIRNLENASYLVQVRIHYIVGQVVRDKVNKPDESSTVIRTFNVHTTGEYSTPAEVLTGQFPGVERFYMEADADGVTLNWKDPDGYNKFTGYFIGVNSIGQCECGHVTHDINDPRIISQLRTEAGVAWAGWVNKADLTQHGDGSYSFTIQGFNPGETVQGCIRPAIGSRAGATQRSARKTIGWPDGTVPGAPGAPSITSLGYGEMFGSNIAPAYNVNVDLWDHYADIGDVPTQYSPLLDWDRLYIVWDRAQQNGAYITNTEWQFRKQGESTWQHGGSVGGHKRRWGEMGKQYWEDANTIATRYFDDGVIYEFRIRSQSSAGWGPWSATYEFLNYTKRGTPGPVRDLRVAQPSASFGAGQWFIRWAHPEWTGAYIQHEGKWGPASIKTYEITVTQPGRATPLRLGGSPETTVRDDGTLVWNLGTAATCRADGLSNGFFYPCSHERVGFEMWFAEVPDVSKPLNVTVRAQNNTAHQGWSVTELEFRPAGPPTAPRNLQVTVDESHVSNGIPTGLHSMTWDAPADDGGSDVHYLFNYQCVVLGGDQHNEYVNDLSGALYVETGTTTVEHLVRNPELSRTRPGTLRCEYIEVYPRNAHFFDGPAVRWTNPAPRQMSPVVINSLGDIHIAEGSGPNEIDLSNVFHDPNGDDFTIIREVTSGNGRYVSEVTSDKKIIVTAPGNVRDCVDQNGTRTCWLTDTYHITLYADDGNHNYGRGGRSGPLRFRVIIDEKIVKPNFNPLVYDGLDLDGDSVRDTDADGTIDRREFQVAKDDYAACVNTGYIDGNSNNRDPDNRKSIDDKTRYYIAGSKLQCNTRELGHPYVNLLMLKALFERTNVKVLLTWSTVTDSDITVSEDAGDVGLKATLWEPAPSDLTLTIQDSPGNVDDFTVSAKKITILKGATESGNPSDATITINDDSKPEKTKRFIILVNGIIEREADGTECVPPVNGPNRCVVAGDATLTIVDNDAGIIMLGSPLELNPGTSATYTLKLESQPSSSVFISTVSSTPFVRVTDFVNINASDWDKPVTFTVTAASDIPVSGLPLNGVRITHRVSSLDDAYEGYSVPTVFASVVASVVNSTPPAQVQPQAPVNHVPTIANPIPDIAELSVGVKKLVYLQNVFSYDGDGDLSIRVGSSDSTKVSVTVSPDFSSLTVTAIEAGTVTISVVATDPNGDQVTDEFSVTVPAPAQQVGQSDPPKSPGTGSAPDTPKPEPTNVQVASGDGSVTVTWDVAPFYYKGRLIESERIMHAIRWWIGTGWANPRGTNGIGVNDGIHVENGVTSYTITGLTNGVGVEVQVRAFFGSNYTEAAMNKGESSTSSTWVKAVGTPQDPNNAPKVASSIPDITITNESGEATIALKGVFTDADSDTLTLTDTYSNSDTALGFIQYMPDPELVIYATQRGTVEVTITASDGKAEVSDTFTVKVKAAPVVASAMSDITGLEIGNTRTPSISGVFSDADGDAITITQVQSSDTAKVAISTAMTTTADGSTVITGFTLTVKDSGTATITVTVQDSDGNSVSDSFDVTVNAAQQQQQVNNAPTVSNAIADDTIVNESSSLRILLAGIFSDADNDTLTVTAESSDKAVATTAISQNTLTVTAKKRGSTTITVKASDGSAEVSDAFTVTVKGAPVVSSAIADITGMEIDDTRNVTVSDAFSDPDGDTLTYNAVSSSNSVVIINISANGSSSSTVVARSAGTATITVTAQDSDGNSVSDKFDVTVNAAQQSQAQEAPPQKAPENQAPTVINEIPDIGDLVIRVAPESIDLSQVFSDPEGGALTYSVNSDDIDSAVVTVTIEDGVVHIVPNGAGTQTVVITAEDNAGNTVSDSFDITVTNLPGTVVGLIVTATADTVTVTWKAPVSGGEVRNYIVHVKPQGGEKGSGKTKRPKAKKTQVTFNKMKAETLYNVWVRAENKDGKGERTYTTITTPVE